MLDPKLIRSNPETVAELLNKRGYSLDVASLKTLEDERKAQEATGCSYARLYKSINLVMKAGGIL